MKIRVIDVESTGLPEHRAKGKDVGICEFAYTDVVAGVIGETTHHLVNPGHPIPPEARAVHHISDDMVSNAMPESAVRDILMEGMEPGDIFAAHSKEMERSFFSGDPYPWICTLQCAKHLWEDAPGYSNQTLRYWLGLDEGFDIWKAMPPHRAGPDTYVTAHILARMLQDHHHSSLLQLTNTPVLLKKVPFGKYQGQPWSEMDRGYLEWCLEPQRNFKPEVIHTARHYLNQLTMSGTPFA